MATHYVNICSEADRLNISCFIIICVCTRLRYARLILKVVFGRYGAAVACCRFSDARATGAYNGHGADYVYGFKCTSAVALCPR